MVLGFGRSVLMARLLTPEDFGVVAFALTFLNVTMPLRDFGLDQALIHRQPDEEMSLDDALTVHFTLRLLLIGLFILLLLAAIPILRYFYPQKSMLVPVLVGLTVGEIARVLGATPTAYLQKEMRFIELIIIQILTSVSMTIVGPLMAWRGWGVWAIVGERISGIIVATLFIWLFIRPWPLRLKFDLEKTKWYLSYGRFIFATRGLGKILQEFDDFWIGTSLGSLALGYYSKSYEFALYPRRIISDPLTKVVFPLFAKLQDNRVQLSKAYFRFSSLVIRVSFLLGGILILGSPDFVYVILGEKWEPMITTFQLMIIYVLLDPLVVISANLSQATGHPDFWTRARVIQVLVFIPAVILGNQMWQINGVALATDVVLLIGLVWLFCQNRRLVDFSLKALFGFPTIAFLLGIIISWQFSGVLTLENQLISGMLKIIAYISIYSTALLTTEYTVYNEYTAIILRFLKANTEFAVPPDSKVNSSG
jgi:O-antigen/teichoic acid export membrane protein